MQHRLDDDDGAVHNQPEVDRPQAHQVTGDAEQVHQRHGEHHRQRDHRGHDQPTSQISQKQHQHEHHDQGPFGQIRHDGFDGIVDELFPVEKRADDHAFRQGRPDLFDAILHRRNDFRRIRSLEHHDDARDDFPFAVARRRPVANAVTQLHGRNIADKQRRSRRR